MRGRTGRRTKVIVASGPGRPRVFSRPLGGMGRCSGAERDRRSGLEPHTRPRRPVRARARRHRPARPRHRDGARPGRRRRLAPRERRARPRSQRSGLPLGRRRGPPPPRHRSARAPRGRSDGLGLLDDASRSLPATSAPGGRPRTPKPCRSAAPSRTTSGMKRTFSSRRGPRAGGSSPTPRTTGGSISRRPSPRGPGPRPSGFSRAAFRAVGSRRSSTDPDTSPRPPYRSRRAARSATTAPMPACASTALG